MKWRMVLLAAAVALVSLVTPALAQWYDGYYDYVWSYPYYFGC